MSASTPRTDALRSRARQHRNVNWEAEAVAAWHSHEQLERELVDARNVQHHIVTMPDGSAVAAPCAISGCQYARPQESATPAAVVIVDAAGNPSVVLDSQFRAALTTGEHVLFSKSTAMNKVTK